MIGSAVREQATEVPAPLGPILWHTFEWLLGGTWLVLTLKVVGFFGRPRWDYGYFDDDGAKWLPVTLFLPLVLPVVLKLFSRIATNTDGMNAQKRFGLIALLAFGIAIALVFRPRRGLDEPTLLGVFVPFGIYALMIFLWLGWRRKPEAKAL